MVMMEVDDDGGGVGWWLVRVLNAVLVSFCSYKFQNDLDFYYSQFNNIMMMIHKKSISAPQIKSRKIKDKIKILEGMNQFFYVCEFVLFYFIFLSKFIYTFFSVA